MIGARPPRGRGLRGARACAAGPPSGARGLAQPGPGPAGRPRCPRSAGGSGAGPAPAPPGSRPGRVGPGGPAARLPTGWTRWDPCSAQAAFFPGLSLLFYGPCRPLNSPPGARARPCQRAAWRHRDCRSLFINDHVIRVKGVILLVTSALCPLIRGSEGVLPQQAPRSWQRPGPRPLPQVGSECPRPPQAGHEHWHSKITQFLKI